MNEAEVTDAGRRFLHAVFGQDSDLDHDEELSEGQLFEAALDVLSADKRNALLAWFEARLTEPESRVRATLRSQMYIEMDPSHWSDPDDPSRTGALALVRYVTAMLRAG